MQMFVQVVVCRFVSGPVVIPREVQDFSKLQFYFILLFYFILFYYFMKYDVPVPTIENQRMKTKGFHSVFIRFAFLALPLVEVLAYCGV
jgi:hypothetical protein